MDKNVNTGTARIIQKTFRNLSNNEPVTWVIIGSSATILKNKKKINNKKPAKREIIVVSSVIAI